MTHRLVLLAALSALSACESSGTGSTAPDGAPATGGVTTGAGGAPALGGAMSNGGQSVESRGGNAGTGGSTHSNGGTSAGGTSPRADGGNDGGASNGGASSGGNGGCGAGMKETIHNGQFWSDTTGNHIQAHGGGILKVGDTWYWIGEDKSQNPGGTGNFNAVNCYLSKDLVNWEFRNSIITRNTDPQLNDSKRVIERPKVIYNEKTRMYVMYLHWDDTTYNNSYAGIFQSPTVDGNYTYVAHIRPGGNDSRDCTLFKEDDGTAYLVSVANTNRDTMVYELTDDYLNIKQTTAKIWAGMSREAPAIFKVNGTYYGITSGSTGWGPNQGEYSTAASIAGPWSDLKNIGDNTTYRSQPTYVIAVQGCQTTTYVYAGDRWDGFALVNSQYVWLPLTLSGTTLGMSNLDQWSLNATTGAWTAN